MLTEERIRSIIRATLLEAYSEKLVLQLIDGFKQENPDLDENTIKAYIDRFQQIKDSPKVENKDITTYSWDDLETLISTNQPKVKTSQVNRQEDTIYNQNGLEILLGNSKDACIKYGEGYRFCISARGERNAFDSYRHDSTTYFVIDHERSNEKNEQGQYIDPYHIIVIMKEDLLDTLTFTDANNKNILAVKEDPNPRQIKDKGYYAERQEATWEDIIKLQPKLKGLENLIQIIEPEEKTKLKFEYDNKLRKLKSEFGELLSFGSSDNVLDRLTPIVSPSPESLDLANNITNHGQRYTLYNGDRPIVTRIRTDNIEPKIWQQKIMSEYGYDEQVLLSVKVTDFTPSEEYLEYLSRARQIILEYYRRLSTLK